MSEITTIKVEKSTKSELDRLKLESESYNSAIKRLVSNAGNSNLREKLVEAYRSMGKEDLELLEDWENASSELL